MKLSGQRSPELNTKATERFRVWRRPSSWGSSSPWRPEPTSSGPESAACSCSTWPGGTRRMGQASPAARGRRRPSYHVVESLLHAVVSGVEKVDFGALHGHGAPPSDLPGHLQGSSHHGLLICKHSAAEETTVRVQRRWGGASLQARVYLTRPLLRASSANIFLAVRANSFTRLEETKTRMTADV